MGYAANRVREHAEQTSVNEAAPDTPDTHEVHVEVYVEVDFNKKVENAEPIAPRTRQTAATDVLNFSKCLWLAFGASEVHFVR